jgi:hypothetical protein
MGSASYANPAGFGAQESGSVSMLEQVLPGHGELPISLDERFNDYRLC